MKVVVITGSRDWVDRPAIERVLEGAEALIVGDARGADAIALHVAIDRDAVCTVFAASPTRAAELSAWSLRTGKALRVEVASDWQKDGARAGHLRNQVIVDEARRLQTAGLDVLCHAFPLPSSVGTHDCVRKLREAGFAVEMHSPARAHELAAAPALQEHPHARSTRPDAADPKLRAVMKARAAVGRAAQPSPARKFVLFWGHERPAAQDHVGRECLSQWYPASFTVAGKHFATAEHCMMHRKAELFGDTSAADRILRCESPREAKAIGRIVRGFDEQVWNGCRVRAVVEANVAKLAENPELMRYLLSTRDAVLVEASPHDRVWGIGLGPDDARALDPAQWRGENHLGFALMTVRAQLMRARAVGGVELVAGDLLRARADALVNPVNTAGVMGKGLALEFKRAFPDNFTAYARACQDGQLKPGEVIVTTLQGTPRAILNVATKAHWREPSRLQYVRDGVSNIVERVRALQLRSIAIPALGCGEGGLAWSDVKPLLERAATQMPNVRVMLFPPHREHQLERAPMPQGRGLDIGR